MFNIKEIFDQIEQAIREHMDAQPYDISCEKCGGSLVVQRKTDSDHDLTITVEPCDKCLTDEYERGVAEGESNA